MMKLLDVVTLLSLTITAQDVIVFDRPSAMALDWREWHKSNPSHIEKAPAASPKAPDENVEEPIVQEEPIDSSIFLEQQIVVPPATEWAKEIITKEPGLINIQVESQSPKSILVVTREAWEKVQNEENPDIDLDKDVFLQEETDDTLYSQDLELPEGEFMIMMENLSSSPQGFYLRLEARS